MDDDMARTSILETLKFQSMAFGKEGSTTRFDSMAGRRWGFADLIVSSRSLSWTSSTLERRLWSVLQNTLCSSNQNVWCSLMLSEGRRKCSIRKLHVGTEVWFLSRLILSNQDTRNLRIPSDSSRSAFFLEDWRLDSFLLTNRLWLWMYMIC